MNFIDHILNQRRFSLRTFGPGTAPERVAGISDHIRKELAELAEKPNDLEEWIDVVLLALDGAWRTGATPEQIQAALISKQLKNESRQWPRWQDAEPGKAIEHLKGRDQ